MTERPILFSAPMVRAILAGTKTQTRRILTVPWKGSTRALPYEPYWVESDGRLLCCDEYGDYHDVEKTRACPHGEVGDRLWVRETWGPVDRLFDGYDRDDPTHVGYRADLSARLCEGGRQSVLDTYALNWDLVKWRPSIHMPRWASRLTLEIVSVRVERLQAISDADAIAEGVQPDPECPWRWLGSTGSTFEGPRAAFWSLWDSINGTRPPRHIRRRAPRGKPTDQWEGAHPVEPSPFRWDANPWVWALTFRRVATQDAPGMGLGASCGCRQEKILDGEPHLGLTEAKQSSSS